MRQKLTKWYIYRPVPVNLALKIRLLARSSRRSRTIPNGHEGLRQRCGLSPIDRDISISQGPDTGLDSLSVMSLLGFAEFLGTGGLHLVGWGYGWFAVRIANQHKSCGAWMQEGLNDTAGPTSLVQTSSPARPFDQVPPVLDPSGSDSLRNGSSAYVQTSKDTKAGGEIILLSR